jgi:hypothetical protein
MEGFMLPFDIHQARQRYNDMLAEAEDRRRANISRSIARPERRPTRDKSLIAQVLDTLRLRRPAHA